MRSGRFPFFATSASLLLLLSACAGPAERAAPEDPFAYCAAVGTADRPADHAARPYRGPAVPDAVAESLRQVLATPAEVPLADFARSVSWRCMEGQLYACTVGANLPCDAKADSSRLPSAAMTAYCAESPDAAFIPAYVTGRATIYAWRCTGSLPAVEKQIATPDARGFLANIWYPLAP